MLSVNMLFESAPEHPDTIIVRNQFYPDGLTQQHIYDYYMKNKLKILDQVKDRDVMILFATDLNKTIVKRRQGEEFIKLNFSNYEKVISGRTLSLISTMNQREDFGIVDIDYHDFNVAKECAAEVYDYLYRQNKNLTIIFTGKSSFHIKYMFDKKININQIRNELKTLLQDLADKYDIQSKRRKDRPNLDLSPNKFRGGYITLHSLSTIGLKCVKVLRKDLLNFSRNDAKI